MDQAVQAGSGGVVPPLSVHPTIGHFHLTTNVCVCVVGGPWVRGNVDPVALFAGKDFITDTIHDTIKKAGTRNHIMVGWGAVGCGRRTTGITRRRRVPLNACYLVILPRATNHAHKVDSSLVACPDYMPTCDVHRSYHVLPR